MAPKLSPHPYLVNNSVPGYPSNEYRLQVADRSGLSCITVNVDGFIRVSELQLSWGVSSSKTLNVFDKYQTHKKILEEVEKLVGFWPLKKLSDGDYIHTSILTTFCCWMSPTFAATHTIHTCRQPTMNAFQTALSSVRGDIENALLNTFSNMKGEFETKSQEFKETVRSFEERVMNHLFMYTPFDMHPTVERAVSAIVGKDIVEAQSSLFRSLIDNISHITTTYYHDLGFFRMTDAAKNYMNVSLEDFATRIPSLEQNSQCVMKASCEFDTMLREIDLSVEPDLDMLRMMITS
eukprot:jgi/Mesvir1/1516/Mv14499-RA.1